MTIGMFSLADYERRAQECLDPAVLAYVTGGSGAELTLQRNRTALDTLLLQQRVLADCRHGNTRLTLLGQIMKHPVLLAPVAFQQLLHAEGELATARAACATDTTLVLSNNASCSLESVADTGCQRWFQLYWQGRNDITLDLLQRASAAGYTALVLTLDTPVQPASLRALRAGFALPAGIGPATMDLYPANKTPTNETPAIQPGDSIVFQGLMQQAPQWEDIAWLLAHTHLPVIAKGVTHPDDAERLASMGIAGIIVSNHGGRALDSSPASIEVLPTIRQRLGNQFPLLVDGGIRSGIDIFRALAAGANAVLVGRPQCYALAVAGALGVAHMIKLLREELESCMALCGCASLADIKQTHLWKN